jgi:hypothetical protein
MDKKRQIKIPESVEASAQILFPAGTKSAE